MSLSNQCQAEQLSLGPSGSLIKCEWVQFWLSVCNIQSKVCEKIGWVNASGLKSRLESMLCASWPSNWQLLGPILLSFLPGLFRISIHLWSDQFCAHPHPPNIRDRGQIWLPLFTFFWEISVNSWMLGSNHVVSLKHFWSITHWCFFANSMWLV